MAYPPFPQQNVEPLDCQENWEHLSKAIPSGKVILNANVAIGHATISSIDYSVGGASALNYVQGGVTWNGTFHLFATSAGIWHADFGWVWAAAAAGTERYIDIIVNLGDGGGERVLCAERDVGSGFQGEQTICGTFKTSNAFGYIYSRVYQSTGANLNGLSGFQTAMSLTKLGP